jgi:hypothetical protein
MADLFSLNSRLLSEVECGEAAGKASCYLVLTHICPSRLISRRVLLMGLLARCSGMGK